MFQSAAFSSSSPQSSVPPSPTRPHHIRAQTSRGDQRHSPCCYIKNFTRFSPTRVNIFFKWLHRIASHPRSASTLGLVFFSHLTYIWGPVPRHCITLTVTLCLKSRHSEHVRHWNASSDTRHVGLKEAGACIFSVDGVDFQSVGDQVEEVIDRPEED